MKHFQLNGQIRQKGNKAVIKAFRRQGLVPCNLYGTGVDNILFTVVEKELQGLTHTPASFIVDLNLDGKVYTAVAHEYQWHPVDDNCLHVDFLAVNEEKPIVISVPLNIYGKPMLSDGVFCGQIFSDIKITNAGVFEVRPVAFSIRDSVSGKVIFRAAGEMQGQVLLADSAAQKIAALTGPHKDWKNTIGGMPLSMFQQQK